MLLYNAMLGAKQTLKYKKNTHSNTLKDKNIIH